jgi:hypothetical protein
MTYVWTYFLILGISSTPWCILPRSHLRIQITSRYLKKSKLFLGMPIGTRRSCLMKKPEIKIMWRCPFKLLSVNNYWYLWMVLYVLSNFLLCKNGSGKISQNFAKLNSLPKFREIRTYKFRDIVETHFRGHPRRTWGSDYNRIIKSWTIRS